MSFTRGTKVLLASGIAVPIASLKPGDKVLATNTKTRKTSAEPVTAVWVHHDTNRYDLTVKTAHGTMVIHTTTIHLFWNLATRRWAKVVALGHESKLRTPAGATAMVLGGHAPRARSGWMWDLTVARDHDFYIQAAASAVLVHNCPNLSYSSKILNQMAPRGWTQTTIGDTVENPVATHNVWDYTSTTAEPATAYVSSNGGYVVVNDATGNVVQISDINDPGWRPVWNDPRFQR